jgi:hypothetical protein
MPIRRIAVLLLVLAAALPGIAQAPDEFQNAQRLHRLGHGAAALEVLARHLATQPRDARARFLKGVILSEQNQRAEAIQVFTALTQDFPELPEPYNNLAVLYAGQGDYERAREALLMAIRTHPSYATAYENLGDVYAAMAREAYEKSAGLEKSNQTAARKMKLLGELLPPRKDAGGAASQSGAEEDADGVPTEAPSTAPAAEASPSAPPAAELSVESPERAAGVAEGRLDSNPESPALLADPQVSNAGTAATTAIQDHAPAQLQQRLDSVLRTVDDWAKAWSDQDADAYLSFYAPSFRPARGESRARWEAARRAELARLRDVDVKVSSPQVAFPDAQHASVTFAQDYASATYKVSGRKTLELVRDGERWLIEQETFVRR